jgi:hypothetical protein
MTNETATGAEVNHSSRLEYTAKQVDLLKTIIGGLVAVLGVAFAGGVFWDQLHRYETIVDLQAKQIEELKGQITTFKTNLGELGDPSYEIEVPNGGPKSGYCEVGNVITGARYDDVHKMWIRCSSLGRAVWNPTRLQTSPPQSP